MKEQKQKGGMLDKMKRSFLRMTSPFEFGGSKKSDSLAFINIAPEMARRDGAYACAVKLLKVNLFANSDQERRTLYSFAETLVASSLEKAKWIYQAAVNERKPLECGEMINYLDLIRHLLGTLEDLSDYQYLIDRSESSGVSFFGNKVVNNLHLSDGIFSNSEIGIYNFLISVLDDAEPTIASCQSQGKKLLSKSESERYEKAYAAFLETFEKITPTDPESVARW